MLEDTPRHVKSLHGSLSLRDMDWYFGFSVQSSVIDPIEAERVFSFTTKGRVDRSFCRTVIHSGALSLEPRVKHAQDRSGISYTHDSVPATSLDKHADRCHKRREQVAKIYLYGVLFAADDECPRSLEDVDQAKLSSVGTLCRDRRIQLPSMGTYSV